MHRGSAMDLHDLVGGDDEMVFGEAFHDGDAARAHEQLTWWSVIMTVTV